MPKHIIRLNTDSGLCGLGETDRGVPTPRQPGLGCELAAAAVAKYAQAHEQLSA